MEKSVIESISDELKEVYEKNHQNTDDEIQRELLKQELRTQEIENYKEGEINWLEGDFWNNWDNLKGHTKNLLGHHEEYDKEKPKQKLFFLSHSNDTIRGKPQLIEQVQKKIPLVRLAIKKEAQGRGNNKIETEIKKIFMVGERMDSRYDGYLLDSLALDFWLYRIISEEGKEYYILSQEKLPNCTCNFKGMLVELDDFAEFSRSMKVKSLSRLFFMKSFEPDIKLLTKEQLITYTQERGITENDWLNFLAYHKYGNYNRFPEEVEMLKSSFVLSGKIHDYPLHLFIMGVAGTKKTCGYIETLGYKFGEELTICEGGASRMKGLEPSFKEKPADIGYLAKCERVGFVDEVGKMIEKMSGNDHRTPNNTLGSINFLLEHKQRQALSGNDGVNVQATGKFIFVTNPILSKESIYQHIGLIDESTLSRFLVWVQDDEEKGFVLNNGVEEFSQTPTQEVSMSKSKSKRQVLDKSSRIYIVENIDISREEFISLFDSCYIFVSEIDEKEVNRIVLGITQLAKEPMKSSVWKPRAYHHVKLLIDGLCKHRCLFKDYDPSFTAKQEDYDLAERILIRMVRGWDSNLAPKEEFR